MDRISQEFAFQNDPLPQHIKPPFGSTAHAGLATSCEFEQGIEVCIHNEKLRKIRSGLSFGF
jgi:hypothetical protein